MLAIASKQLNSTFERIVRDKNGVLVRVRFSVVEINGEFQPQIISVEAISKNVSSQDRVICLPTLSNLNKNSYIYKPSFVSKISPYFSLDFLMSQPTRAPAL